MSKFPPAISRRTFLGQSAAAVALSGMSTFAGAGATKSPIIDTHMHIWSGDPEKFPFDNPNSKTPHDIPKGTPGTAELLIQEMDEFGVTQCVIVQVIYH